MIDNWSVRKWIMWLPCALKGHPYWGTVEHYLVGTVFGCSCGRRRWNANGDRLRAMEE